MSCQKQYYIVRVIVGHVAIHSYGLTHFTNITFSFARLLNADWCNIDTATTTLLLLSCALFTATGSAMWTYTACKQLAGYDATRGAGD